MKYSQNKKSFFYYFYNNIAFMGIYLHLDLMTSWKICSAGSKAEALIYDFTKCSPNCIQFRNIGLWCKVAAAQDMPLVWVLLIKTNRWRIQRPICRNNRIPKLVMLTSRAHYEPLKSNWSEKCECVVEFLFFSCKRLCTVNFGIRNINQCLVLECYETTDAIDQLSYGWKLNRVPVLMLYSVMPFCII